MPEIKAGEDKTFVGVDINESNVMLTAVKDEGEILDTLSFGLRKNPFLIRD